MLRQKKNLQRNPKVCDQARRHPPYLFFYKLENTTKFIIFICTLATETQVIWNVRINTMQQNNLLQLLRKILTKPKFLYTKYLNFIPNKIETRHICKSTQTSVSSQHSITNLQHAHNKTTKVSPNWQLNCRNFRAIEEHIFSLKTPYKPL